MSATPTLARQQRRRALAHQCTACRRLWALRLVPDPQGASVRCSYCDAPRAVVRRRPADGTGRA